MGSIESRYTYSFLNIDRTSQTVVGGKGANLGELKKIPGIRVPEGFCLSTNAFSRIIESNPSMAELIRLISDNTSLSDEDVDGLSRELRGQFENVIIPADMCDEILQQLKLLGHEGAFAVRSSATAEDLPWASFAGQHDTFLNVVGVNSLLAHIRRCWASLFADRAVLYRRQNGFDHRSVTIAVVVQKMVNPHTSGILFTADPITGNRKVVSIDAGFGLGEGLVSGIVNADNYKLRNGVIVERRISTKEFFIAASGSGGTEFRSVLPEMKQAQVLSDEQILRLESLGRLIEEHFGSPQDIEWCIVDDEPVILQTRPITTLYPVPESNDADNHVYVSVGHQQMMTDAMKPLGLSLWQLVAAGRAMLKAGGRLFVDVTGMLASPTSREVLLANMQQFDPRIKEALIAVLNNGFIQELSPDVQTPSKSVPSAAEPAPPDPSVVQELISKSEEDIEVLGKVIAEKSGAELLDIISEDIARMRKLISDPRSMGLIMAAIGAATWINKMMHGWLGERNAADVLNQSVPGNITSEMGLELLNVADTIRPFPEVIRYLQELNDGDLLDGIKEHEGGEQVLTAIQSFLDRYGMRCPGEIDITRMRFREKPSLLVPALLANIRNVAPGEAKRRFERGQRLAREKEEDLMSRLRQLPDGEEKAAATKRRIDIVRMFSGYREYPKYTIVSRLSIYRKALLEEAGRLVDRGIIRKKEDIYYLTFQELKEVVQSGKADCRMIDFRKEEHKVFEKLAPPRVITSDGEIVEGRTALQEVPTGSFAGLGVSPGEIEGRARVVLGMEDAILEEGDILITRFTDPSWTPVFLSIKGLVTEVGGLMTHGAVIAREYGLPAIVGVENATKVIRDGQRIRLDGTNGIVQILSEP